MICWAETIAWPLIQPLVDYGYVFTCCFLFIKDQAMHPLGLLLLRLLWKCQSFCAHILKFIVQGIGVGYFLACKLHIFVCVHTAYVCDFAHMHAIFILVLLVGHRCFYIINVVYMPHQYGSVFQECTAPPLHHPTGKLHQIWNHMTIFSFYGIVFCLSRCIVFQ
jgi:hypothetical protein